MTAAEAGRRSWWRWLAALLVVLLLGQAARVAVVRAEGERRPERALAVWSGHPTPLFATALTGIGAAAREGKSPTPDLLAMVERGAGGAPLAAEPLWVAATARLEAGDLQRAERLLRLAVQLDARAPAGRFLLADLALRQGRLDEALTHLSALHRRMPGLSAGLAPALGRYLRQPGAVAEVAPLLLRDPPLRQAVLASLAADPDDSAQLLAMVHPGDQREPWFGALIRRRLEMGDIGIVKALFARVLPGHRLGQSLSSWGSHDNSHPFAWTFPGNGGGVAEPVPAGPLRILHYGRENSSLAEHLLMLGPGRYRLADRFAGSVPEGALEWALHCVQGGRALGFVSAGRRSATPRLLTVPSDCPVQRLALVGKAGEVATTLRAELQSVSLERVGGA